MYVSFAEIKVLKKAHMLKSEVLPWKHMLRYEFMSCKAHRIGSINGYPNFDINRYKIDEFNCCHSKQA